MRNKIYILYSLLSIVLLFNGCASVSPSILNPVQNPLPKKLKPIKFGLENTQIQISSVKSVIVQTDFATIFSRSLEQNICEYGSDKLGFVDLRVVFDDWQYDKTKIRNSILALNPYGLILWSIWGGKCLWYIRLIQVEIGIYDSNRNLIKKYIIDGTTSTGVNLYGSGGNYGAFRMSGIDVIHKVVQKFENQVLNDIDFLNKELLKIGSITNE